MAQELYLDQSIALAGKVQAQFIDLGKKSRGVKQAPYMVLHKAYMPRVLIEMGFISNKAEGAILDSEDGQNAVAESIANAIISYKKEYFGASTSDTITKPSQKIEATKVVDSTPKQESNKPENDSKTETKTEIPVVNSSKAIFKVQLSAKESEVEITPSNFNGLSNISFFREGIYYKYTFGETSKYEEAKRLLAEVKSKGFTLAFLIAFKNGKKISVQEALK